ncbi:MAG: alpha amylase [Lachnospiraceae bacterium]|nr:alpha amylase [Lachnospiraceae bacterium]
MITGCGAQTSQPASALQEKPDEQESSIEESAPENELSETIPEYVYEPNIIDDNYRNYYEIFTGSFCDSNGDGSGDLNGITSKLDYISGLGCNGIWLTPVMAAPSYHKYDTTDYYSIDPAFGTNEDFKALADACHDRGIRLVIDLVINHSSSEHPWFTEACDYLRNLPEGADPAPEECPYVDYYHFSKERSDSYCEVSGSNWYYEAVFNYTQPDLNLYNEELITELKSIAAFWIDLGCDGFRMDAAMHYDDESSSYNIDFLKDYYSYCLSLDPDFYMVSEVWAPEKVIAEYYLSETPSFFNFDVADAEGKLIRAGRGTLSAEKFVNACLNYETVYGNVNPDYIDAPFITNHDMGRVANAVMSDPVTLKMTAGLLLTMSGSPFIYYGEEIGMKSKGKADENKRLHMNWSNTDPTGICNDPEGADKDIEQSFPPADEQINDPDSILSYYKEALEIRNAFPEIARGKIDICEGLTKDDLAVITKTWQNETIAIVYNTSDDIQSVEMDTSEIEGMVLSGELNAVTPLADGNTTDGQGVSGNKSYCYIEGTFLHIPAKTIVFLK